MATSAPPDVIVPAEASSPDVLARLFPALRPPPSVLAPARMPNAGPEATAALLKALKDNHERSHVFFNQFSFHNHSAHHLLALYALGAPSPTLSAAYQDTHLDHMRIAFVAPERVVITDDNFTEYLGNDQYYNAYLDYFHRVVLEPGATIPSLLEKYLFSEHYNIRTPMEGTQQPEMLNRFLEILVHPIIHVGYGAEFGLLGMIAEGLAWTSVHPAGATTLISRLLFTPKRTTPITELEKQEPEWLPKPGSRLRALNILSLMLRDPRFGSKVLDKHEYAAMLESHGEVINRYGEMWDCDVKNQEDLEKYLEELIWAGTLMYGVGSWDGDEAEYRADFFTAHIVTSALFLPSLCAHISHRSQTLLLRAHFLTSITWWLVRGRPGFPLQKFTSYPLPPLPNSRSSKYTTTLPGAQPIPSACALPSPTSPYAIHPNPWYTILADAIVHPNEHLCKVQRALAHFNTLYGYREAGFVMDALNRDKDVGVDVDPNYAYLDGTVFLRVAWLTGAALGWVREGEPNSGVWNYQEFQKAALEELELLEREGKA
ncbi:hypothetical protein F5I97DRAFT_1829234 [Phlebopus sp. FC_14]|nr:hypothetical protein F5I97DRAFT_1829234 [Phlebopus sp. FC_14]